MEVRIDARRILDSGTFHSVFAEMFGFPEFYGENMNSWIDCMTSLDDPEAALSTVHVAPGEVVSLVIEHAAELKGRCPEQFAELLECSAFVNWRRIEQGHPPVLALALYL